MESTVSALAVLAVLTAWHLRNRRHPGWLASPDGRFYIFCGYALVAIAAYWLQEAPTATAWEWAFGNLWALAGMVAWCLDSVTSTASPPSMRSRRRRSRLSRPPTPRRIKPVRLAKARRRLTSTRARSQSPCPEF